MDKYVIDLDKVLDELELNDKYDESNSGNCPQSTVKYDSINSLINLNDKIDVNEADFSIHIKPPKLLIATSTISNISPENVFIEHNNNIQTVEQINKLNSDDSEIILETAIHPITNDDVSNSQIGSIIELKCDEKELTQMMNMSVIDCQGDNVLSTVSKTQISNTERSNVEVLIHNEDASSEEKNYQNGYSDCQIEEKNCDNNKMEEVNIVTNLKPESNDNLDISSTNLESTIVNENNSNSQKIILESSVGNLGGDFKETESNSKENENSDINKQDFSAEELPLNEDLIKKMSEEDLDKYLGDLNNDLENSEYKYDYLNDSQLQQNSFNSDQMNSMTKNVLNNNLQDNLIYSNSSLPLDKHDKIDASESIQNENENLIWSNEELNEVNETESQLQELEELLVATPTHENASVSNSETRRGLVQNINYFERQEMPNGLTEEEQMLGKVKPFWIPDEDAQNCLHCDVKFTLIKRRHHCRSCGKVLCSQCCNFKAKLPYLENKEARVCQLCFRILMRIEEIERINGHQLDISLSNPISLNNSMDHNIPDPNNPAEYCSTIPPLEQVSEAIHLPPPTVMVPVGVLKRPGSSNMRRSNNSPESSNGEREPVKQVMFSDGVRPGGDLVEPPSSSRLPDDKPISRTQFQLNKSPISEKILVPFENFSKRIKLSRVVCVDYNGLSLPPILNYNELKSVDPSLPSKPSYNQLIEYLRNPQMPWITFGLTKNLHINAKIVSKTCCNNKECWSFSSKGLASVGQDEILFVLDCDSLKRSTIDGHQNNKSTVVTPSSNDILVFPRDVFRLYTTIYDSASTANLYMDLTHIFFPDGFFNNKENSGFIFTRPTLQCFQNIHIPSPPFLIAILIHKWEIPWAKVFPLRLVLRLGYEYKMYPSPVISYANRKSAYFEIGHTIMNVLADFRNFHYTLSVVKDLFICVEEKKKVSLLIPKLNYEKVCKVLSTSNEHVLAFGGNLSLKADSHFVCVQNEDDDDIHSQYRTQLSFYPGSAKKYTGASFIVFSGALKSSTGLKAKMNIVEDGLLVQIPPSMMEELRSAIKDMKDFKIECCKVTENVSSEEWVQIKWVNDELSTNLGVRSQIDGYNLEGVQSARIFSNPDYANDRYLIRWIEVFLLQINDNSRRSEVINANRLAESVAQAFCVALIDYLDQLYENGLTKISLRISLGVDKVGYETGSGGKPLPLPITQPLDSALIPVIMENISTTGIEDPLVIELLFFVLLK